MNTDKLEIELEKKELRKIVEKIVENNYKLATINKQETTLEYILEYKNGSPYIIEELRIYEEGIALETLELTEKGAWSLIDRLYASAEVLEAYPVRLI
jgi:hypothetical protein